MSWGAGANPTRLNSDISFLRVATSVVVDCLEIDTVIHATSVKQIFKALRLHLNNKHILHEVILI